VRLTVALVAALLIPMGVDAQAAACPPADAIVARPDTPRAGTLFRVLVRNASPASVTHATLAGEPLHFRADGDALTAFAAVPVDSSSGLTLALLCTDGTRRDLRLGTRDGAYPLERLRVAPRFTAPPDSALLARQRREAARAAEVSRAAHRTPRLFTEPFVAPRASRITSGFGGGRTFNGTVTSRHMGTDYAGAVGAPVRAANRGVVRLVDAFHLGGNVIYLDHGEGLVTAYLHLSRQRVAVGDTVQRGDVIGEVGATGRVTGPHLHLIVRYGNITVDPESVIARR
jgi:murein DD-endopeptidase MepM/ murein hydrolase activator NlpD